MNLDGKILIRFDLDHDKSIHPEVMKLPLNRELAKFMELEIMRNLYIDERTLRHECLKNADGV